MDKIEQAREVSLRLKRAPLQNGSSFHSEVTDTIDALLAELAALSLDRHTETAAVIALRAELDTIKSQEPVAYGIRQITDDEGVEEWEDIRTSPDVAKEEADGMMETGRGERYEVVPLYSTAGVQASVTCQIYGHVVGACVECNTHEEADQKAELAALKAQQRIGMLKPCKEGWFADLDNPPPLGSHESIPFYLAAGAHERKPLKASEIVTMYAEQPMCDADMIEFAREVEAAHGIKEQP